MPNLSSAQCSYAAAGKEARVLNANGHELITILFEELLNLLDEIYIIHTRDQDRALTDQRVMALTILDSLMVSLDMEKGGDLARNLHQLYGQVRELVAVKDRQTYLKNNRAAHQIISEIYTAWCEIG